jgi:hypothetical protein
MSLRVANLNEMPPKGWRYIIPELPAPANSVGPFPAYGDLLTEARKRYLVNSLMAPLDLEEKIHEWMCAHIPPQHCEESKIHPLRSAVRGTISIGDMVRGARTLAQWSFMRVTGQAERVNLATANKRASVCVGCSQRRPISGCVSCTAGHYFALVTKISGGQKLDEPDIGGCAVCGCGLEGKVWMDKKVLTQKLDAELLSRYPEHCWLVREDVP